MVVSNVSGPQFPLYMAGAQLVANYPVSVITDGMGLNVTVMSYCGHLDFGIVADREQMRDVWKLIGWLEDSLAELLPPGAEVKPPAPRLEESLLPGLRPAAVGAAHRGRDLSLEHEAALTGVERLVLQRGQLAASARRRHRRSAPSAGSWRLLAGGGVVLARGAGLTAPRSEAVTSLS